ncbi:MAG TPA: hypothetical protein VHD33_05620, partial [Legionellaceae bacterium]|nr:hypothetical protein [Legionellaceae bacterium]
MLRAIKKAAICLLNFRQIVIPYDRACLSYPTFNLFLISIRYYLRNSANTYERGRFFSIWRGRFFSIAPPRNNGKKNSNLMLGKQRVLATIRSYTRRFTSGSAVESSGFTAFSTSAAEKV